MTPAFRVTAKSLASKKRRLILPFSPELAFIPTQLNVQEERWVLVRSQDGGKTGEVVNAKATERGIETVTDSFSCWLGFLKLSPRVANVFADNQSLRKIEWSWSLNPP